MTDRQIVYDGALPQTTDILGTNKFAMVGLAYALRAALGDGMWVHGLTVSPTTPTASLQVVVSAGSIYALEPTDTTAYSDLGIDNTTIMKQGVLVNPATLTITPPGTVGYSQVYLVQAAYQDLDTGAAVLPYYNSSNPSQPYSGPNNDGQSQYTIRTGNCLIELKAGDAAPTGSQVTPTADPGFVGIYSITVANGATQITSANITLVGENNYFPTLPEIPGDVQQNKWTYAADTSAVANSIVATVHPNISTLVPGTIAVIKVANGVTGATTLNLNGLGAIAVHRASGSALQSGDIPAGAVIAFLYDGSAWQIMNYTGLTTGTITNNLNSFAIPYGVDAGSVNAMSVATFSPTVTSLSAGMPIIVKALNTNTGATTLNPSSLGAVAIKENGVDLLPGAILAGEDVLVIYDGTFFQKINARWPYTSFDLATPPSTAVNMKVGDQVNISFSNVTSIPLHVACVPGVYEVEFCITASNSFNNDMQFLPNDTSFPSDTFSGWQIENTDIGAAAPPFVAPNPVSNVKFPTTTGQFTIDMFSGPLSNDNLNDIGPWLLKLTISTFTAAKTMRQLGGIAGGPAMGFYKWGNTSTAWTSLGTLKVYTTSGLAVLATISGVAIVKRLA